MNPIAATAASALRARMESLDLVANNLANAGTDGFKADYERYGTYISDQTEAGDSQPDGMMPVLEKPYTDFSQGTLRPTGNPLDLALSGRGLFVVRGPSGPLYSRNGGFHMTPAGDVVTTEGYPVLLENNVPLKAASRSPLDISTDGTVSQDGQVLGKLQVVDVPAGASLARMGHSYFRPADPAAVTPSAAEVQQGKLESSNSGSAESAVRLVGIMRQFEMLQKAISLTGDMDKQSVEQVARVGA